MKMAIMLISLFMGCSSFALNVRVQTKIDSEQTGPAFSRLSGDVFSFQTKSFGTVKARICSDIMMAMPKRQDDILQTLQTAYKMSLPIEADLYVGSLDDDRTYCFSSVTILDKMDK